MTAGHLEDVVDQRQVEVIQVSLMVEYILADALLKALGACLQLNPVHLISYNRLHSHKKKQIRHQGTA